MRGCGESRETVVTIGQAREKGGVGFLFVFWNSECRSL